MKTGFRIVLTFFFTSVVVFFTAFFASVFALYWQARTTVAEIQSLASRRGSELGIALSTMATEQWAKDKGMVALSATFTDLVRLSKSRSDDFVIDEILLVDQNGKLRAHSDVTRLAKDAGSTEYSKPEYKQLLNVSRRDPVFSQPLPVDWSQASPQEAAFMRILPGLANTRTHIGVAVFPVDADFPSAGIHLFVTIRSMAGIVAGLTQSALYTLAAVAGLSFVFSFLLTIILYFVAIRPGAAKAAAARVKLPSGVEFLEATASPLSHHQAVISDPGRIMDAIPLDSH